MELNQSYPILNLNLSNELIKLIALTLKSWQQEIKLSEKLQNQIPKNSLTQNPSALNHQKQQQNQSTLTSS